MRQIAFGSYGIKLTDLEDRPTCGSSILISNNFLITGQNLPSGHSPERKCQQALQVSSLFSIKRSELPLLASVACRWRISATRDSPPSSTRITLQKTIFGEFVQRSSPLKRNSVHFVGAALLLAAIFLAYSLLPGSHTLSSAPAVLHNSAPKIQASQHYINRTPLTTHTTPAFDSSGGGLIVLCASSHSGVLMAPSDSFNNTWISAVGPTSNRIGPDLRTEVWYAKNPRVGAGHTFAVNLSSSQPLVISLLVVSGSDVSDPIDAVSTIGDDAGLQSSHVASPPITTTSANDLLIGFAKSATGQVWTSGSDFKQQGAASSSYLGAETGFAETPGKYQATFDLNSPGSWQAVTLAVKPASERRPFSSSPAK